MAVFDLRDQLPCIQRGIIHRFETPGIDDANTQRRSPQDAASEVALLASRRRGKCSLIENLST
jgi:hypothetical protein